MKPQLISIYDKAEIKTGAHKRHIGLLGELSKREYSIHFFAPVNFLDQTEHYYKISAHKESLIPKSLQSLLAVRKEFKKVRRELPSTGVIVAFGFNHIYASLYLQYQLGFPLIFVVRSNVYEYRKIKYKGSGNRSGFHAVKGSLYLNIFKKIAGYAYRKADKVVVQNKKDLKNIVSRYNVVKTNVEVIRNNIDFLHSEASEYENQSTELQSLVFAGTLSKRKGIVYLVEAVRELVKDDINIRLDILGDGNLKNELEAFVESNDLEQHIKIHGYVSDPLSYFAEADLMVIPSLMDSFPNSALEALSVGVPVIGSKVGGIPEILQYDELLFEPGNSEAIKKKLVTLLEPSEYLRAKRQCEERRDEFSFDWTKEFEDIINAV